VQAGGAAARPATAPPRPAGRAHPGAALEQWQDTEAALTLLYRHAEGRAIDAIDWYLQDRRSKRVWSRGLRLLVILLVTAGGLQPLLDAAAPGPGRTAWGYVLLALAAACIGFDPVLRWLLGLDALHDHRQALERRLEQLQYDWAAECARSATRTVDPKQVQNRLALLRAVADDMAALMQQETAEWVLEFQSNLLRLETSTGGLLELDPGPHRPRPRERRVARPRRRGVAGTVRDPGGSVGWDGPPGARGDPDAMPTDHGPELEALRKRLADAKEFL
jgi:hypothetical protein